MLHLCFGMLEADSLKDQLRNARAIRNCKASNSLLLISFIFYTYALDMNNQEQNSRKNLSLSNRAFCVQHPSFHGRVPLLCSPSTQVSSTRRCLCFFILFQSRTLSCLQYRWDCSMLGDNSKLPRPFTMFLVDSSIDLL